MQTFQKVWLLPSNIEVYNTPNINVGTLWFEWLFGAIWQCVSTNGLEQRLVAETGAAIRVVSSACCSVINGCSVSSPLAPNGAGGNHCRIHIHTFSPHSLLFSLFFSLSLFAFCQLILIGIARGEYLFRKNSITGRHEPIWSGGSLSGSF